MFDDSPVSKVLALQDRGLKFDPPEPTQKMGGLGMVAQSRRQRGLEDRQIPGTHWPVSLAYLVSSKARKHSDSKI